jgi:N-acetylneuraminate synthase
MTILVSELGINHNGSFQTLKKMADESFRAGADYVKIQMRTPELCVPRHMWDTPRVAPWGETMTYMEYRNRMEFTQEQLREFDEYTDGKWFPSVFDVGALDRALELGVNTIKVPSAMMTNEALMKRLENVKRRVIVSTGMSTLSEIIENVGPLYQNRGAHGLFIMHCNSAYPTPEEEINLMGLVTLQRMFPYASIGFSSHATSPYPAIYAAVFGAEMLEVHFTLDRTLPGSDHAASLEFPGLALIARELKRIKKVMGNGKLKLYPSEMPARKKLRIQ